MTTNPQSKRGEVNQRSQQKINRRCSCGRVITGNAAWWSHLHAAENRGEGAAHAYAGRR